MPTRFAEGVCLSGRFRLSHCIGEGGMGVVWAATNTKTMRKVALKMLKAETAGDKRFRKRFLREARAASAVQHPNVVEILDVIELEDGSPSMVMELLHGESLGHRFREHGKFEVGEIAAIMLPAISAVGAAHAVGIVHRDLKPDNIFLARGPENTTIVKVLDFGIAKVSMLDNEAGQTDLVTGTDTMLGTPYYMSPEQVFADKVIDYRSDIWALGVILYQCLAGVRPTQGENVGQIMKIIMTNAIVPLAKLRPDLPADLAAIVGRMLSSDREARPQSLKDVCDVLRKHSDVTIPTFGDPVFVNVVEPSSSSGSLRSQDATRPDSGKIAVSDEPPTKILPASASDSIQTAEGLSVSRARPALRPAWPRYAAIGVLLAGIIAVVAVRMTGATAVRPAPPEEPKSVATATETSKAASSATPLESKSADKPLAAASADRASAAPDSSADKPLPVVDPSARPNPRQRPTAAQGPHPTPAASGPPPARVTTSASSTTAPGGLVEKPPF